MIVQAHDANHTVVVKDNGYNWLAGDCTLDHNADTLTLICYASGAGHCYYMELARSNNG